MKQHKNQQSKHRETPKHRKTATPYTLELLESRMLLSADLAGAIQVVPANQAAVPQQAVVLQVQAPAAAGQRTFSVSEMLSKPAGSFPQTSNDVSRTTMHESQETHAAPETLARSAEAHRRMSSQQRNAGSQLQEAPLTSSPTPTERKLIATPVMNTLQNQTALPRAGQQSQDTLTVVEILALQIQQPIAQEPTQLTEAEIVALQTQQPVTLAPANLTDTEILAAQTHQPTSQPAQSQTKSVSEGVVPVPVNQTTPISTNLSGSSTTNTAINPELPRAYVDTSMPTTSLTVRVGPHGDYADLQTALNNVSLGTTILLQPGVSYTTTNELGFVLPNKTAGTGWIVIKPDMPDSALPASGTRVTPADSAWMPKIVRGNGNIYAVSSEAGAHNYRIIGVEVMNQGNADTSLVGAAFVNLTNLKETSLAAQSHDILFDRVYIHGPSAGGSIGVKFGIVFGGRYEGVIDSTIEDITYGSDAIAVGSWSGAGPFVIRNNALSSSGENIMFGGADTQIAGLVPSDIEIRDNYIYKPLKWRDDVAYNSGPNKILVKNLYESKNVERIIIDGNVFENMWPGAQAGFAMTFVPRQATALSSQPWTVIQDVTITNNVFKNTANGLYIAGMDIGTMGPPTQLGRRYLINNNLFENTGGYPATGIIFQLGNGVSDVTIRHNTVAASADYMGTTLMFTYGPANADYTPMERFVLQDNLLQGRSYPLHAEAGLSAAIPGYLWTNNVFTGPWPTSGGWTDAMMPQGNGNSYPDSEADVGYVNLAAGDYRLSPTSPYKGAASDGTDIGVNWDQFNTANS